MQTKIILFFIVSFLFSGCQTHFHSGALITQDEINQIANHPETISHEQSNHGKVKILHHITKSNIQDKFGSPNIIPDYSKDTWYYVHRDMTKRAFFNPVIVSQKIVKFTFSGDKLVEIESFENKHDGEIKVISEYTRAHGTELNPIQEYIGNIGRFNSYRKKETRR